MGAERAKEGGKEGVSREGTREARQALIAAATTEAGPASPSAPGLVRQDSVALVEQIKKQAKQVRRPDPTPEPHFTCYDPADCGFTYYGFTY